MSFGKPTGSGCIKPLRIGDKALTSKSFRPKHMKVTKHVIINGKHVPIVQVSKVVDDNANEIRYLYALAETSGSPRKCNPKMTGQTGRIYKFLAERPNVEVSSVELHRVGSGKENGWCNSISRRVSDCRSLGMTLVKTREIIVSGSRQTYYKNVVA
jgi:hypothetical protein